MAVMSGGCAFFKSCNVLMFDGDFVELIKRSWENRDRPESGCNAFPQIFLLKLGTDMLSNRGRFQGAGDASNALDHVSVFSLVLN